MRLMLRGLLVLAAISAILGITTSEGFKWVAALVIMAYILLADKLDDIESKINAMDKRGKK